MAGVHGRPYHVRKQERPRNKEQVSALSEEQNHVREDKRDWSQATPTERSAEAARLYTLGWTYQQIADALGYANHTGAYKACQRALVDEADRRSQPLDLLRLRENARLDMLFKRAVEVMNRTHYATGNQGVVWAPTRDSDFVIDNGGNTGVVIGDGETGDSNPNVGAITFIGAIGDFSITVSTGVSNPTAGTTKPGNIAELDLNVLASSNKAGTLRISLEDTDYSSLGFNGPLGILGVVSLDQPVASAGEPPPLVHRRAQRMERVYARDLQRRGIEPGAFERLHEVAMVAAELEVPRRIEAHEHGRDLEQRVRCAVEAAGLDVDDHGQEPAKPRRDRRQRLVGRGRRVLRAHVVSRRASSSGPAFERSSSSVKRTPNPVMSVGMWASPPLCWHALKSTCTHGIVFGTKRLRKRAPRM